MKHNQTKEEAEIIRPQDPQQPHLRQHATGRTVLACPRLFHHTRATNAMKIVKSGEIKPATQWVPKRERPVVWFSSHPLYEPTALSATTEGGRIRRFTTIDELAVCETPFRFEVNPDEFPLGWRAFVNLSGCRRKVSRELGKIAEAWGSNIRDWRISFEPVALERCLGIEAWFREWKPVTLRVFDQAIPPVTERIPHILRVNEGVSPPSAPAGGSPY